MAALAETCHDKRNRKEVEQLAQEKVLGIFETACAAAFAICDEYMKDMHPWPTQRPGTTKEEMEAARMAQDQLLGIHHDADSAAGSVCVKTT